MKLAIFGTGTYRHCATELPMYLYRHFDFQSITLCYTQAKKKMLYYHPPSYQNFWWFKCFFFNVNFLTTQSSVLSKSISKVMLIVIITICRYKTSIPIHLQKSSLIIWWINTMIVPTHELKIKSTKKNSTTRLTNLYKRVLRNIFLCSMMRFPTFELEYINNRSMY